MVHMTLLFLPPLVSCSINGPRDLLQEAAVGVDEPPTQVLPGACQEGQRQVPGILRRLRHLLQGGHRHHP